MANPVDPPDYPAIVLLASLKGQPTEPGTYWFQSDRMSREVLVQVRSEHGDLIAWWLNQDTPVCDMTGRWRGPIPPSTGAGSHTVL